jgi:hypothetical protein
LPAAPKTPSKSSEAKKVHMQQYKTNKKNIAIE